MIIIALLALATVFLAETKGAANETKKVCSGANLCSDCDRDLDPRSRRLGGSSLYRTPVSMT